MRSSLSLPRNLIINGAFDFWQRSVGPVTITTGAVYAAPDRWMLRASGGSASFAAQRSSDTPSNAFFWSLQCTENGDANGNSQNVFQKIEAADIRPLIGRIVTVSAWVKVETVSRSLQFQVYTPSSLTEDIWNADPLIGDTLQFSGPTVSPTLATWTFMSYSFIVPANAVYGLMVRLGDAASYSGIAVLKMTGVSLTEGTAAPSIFRRAGQNAQEELAMCLRFYEKIQAPTGGNMFAVGTATSTTGVQAMLMYFKKRVTPTLALFGAAAGDFVVRHGASTVAVTTLPAAGNVMQDRARVGGSIVAAGLTAGTAVTIESNNSSAYVEIGAEL